VTLPAEHATECSISNVVRAHLDPVRVPSALNSARSGARYRGSCARSERAGWPQSDRSATGAFAAVWSSMCDAVGVTHQLYSAATQASTSSSDATPLELLALGALFAALGICALVFRRQLRNIYPSAIGPGSAGVNRFMYFISCLAVPALFAVVGTFAFVLGLVRI
jgi:hypothetical protein